MTTQSNHDEVLNTLKAILGLIKWIGIPFITGMAFLVLALVSDHYDQVQLDQDRDYMKPKVTRMWLKEHPELTIKEIESSDKE